MTQKVKYISIEDLVFWTENPRDLIALAPNMTDQEMADRAISKDGRSRWSLNKLFEKMGGHFDFSELPTVVYKDKKPVVYDGNRRVLIGKIIHGLVEIEGIGVDFSKFDFPGLIPCNICDEKTALENVYRKHAKTGSWGALERDIFRHRQMKEDKSTFLIFEEATGIISRNRKLNQRFIRDEVLTEKNLEKLGFSTAKGVLQSQYEKDKDAIAILDAVVGHIERGDITTRESRGDIAKLLDNKLLDKKNIEKLTPLNITQEKREQREREQEATDVTKGEQYKLFGNKVLVLEKGFVNDLYVDLCNLHEIEGEEQWSSNYYVIIHAGFRLILEAAADDLFSSVNKSKRLRKYIEENLMAATEKLSEKERYVLYRDIYTNAEGKEQRIDRLLNLINNAAHGNRPIAKDQGLSMSLILGKMLEISHGKK